MADKITEKNKNTQFTETLTNSAEHGIISQTAFFDKEISNLENISNYYVVESDDFVYNPRISNFAPVGPIKRNKLNRTGVMSPLYTVFRFKNSEQLGFYEHYFDSTAWHKYMLLNGDTGARADRIAIKDSTFFEMPLFVPRECEEYVLIAKTMKSINYHITLHQYKWLS